MKNSDKVVLLEVGLGVNTIQKKLQKFGLLESARNTLEFGTLSEKLEMFEQVSRLFQKSR